MLNSMHARHISHRDKMKKHVNYEKSKKLLNNVSLNEFMYDFNAISYRDEIIFIMFYNFVVIVTLKLQSVIYQRMQFLFQFEMLANYTFVFEVDLNMWIYDIFDKWKNLDFDILLDLLQKICLFIRVYFS